MSKQFGFAAAQIYREGRWGVMAASMENGVITLHEISGLGKAPKAKPNTIFFPFESEGERMDGIAFQKANEKARQLNYEVLQNEYEQL